MILWLLAALPLFQLPTDTSSYSMTAVVVDAKGVPLRDLAMADVSLTNDGAIVALKRFERDERPLKVALVLDSSQPLGTAYRLHFLDAAKAFIGSLPSNTRLSVWTTGDRPVKVVDQLDLSEENATRQAASLLGRVAPMGGNTILDAVVEAAEDLKKQEGERSVLVFLSGEGAGFASDSRQGITDRVLKTGVEVMGVLVSETGDATGGGEVTTEDYNYVFSNTTEKTAGRFERPLSVMGSVAALRRVAADLVSTYRLSFSASGKRRFKTALQVARPGVKLRLSTPQRETSPP